MDSDVPKQAFLSMCGVLFLLSLLEFDLDLRHTTCITDVSGRAARQRERPYAERDDAVGLTVVYDVEERLERAWSRWQTGEVFSTQFFGNVLLLDNEVMITEHDEEHYHEMMAQVPLAYRPQATHGLVIGGGDGGTLRQFLKNPNIESVTMVEIDEMVVELSRRHFPQMARAFADPRTHLVFENGATWVNERLWEIGNNTAGHPLGGPFDVIVIDSTDFGNALPLFSSAFYSNIRGLLKPGGILTFNVDSPSWSLPMIASVTRQLGALYKHAYLYQAFQPTYSSGHYAFMFASDEVHPTRTPIDWGAYHAKGMDLHYHTPDVHYAAFALPAFVGDVVGDHVRLEDGYAHGTVQPSDDAIFAAKQRTTAHEAENSAEA